MEFEFEITRKKMKEDESLKEMFAGTSKTFPGAKSERTRRDNILFQENVKGIEIEWNQSCVEMKKLQCSCRRNRI